MAVLINFKICDNAKECNGIAACPTGAFGWDEENKTIFIDEEKCINCGKCNCCPVGAIHFTRTQEEYIKAKKEIDEDPRTISDLYIDRYGASPIQEECITLENELEQALERSGSLVLELYNEDTIQCLLKSIPIREILKEFDDRATFRKIEITTNKLLDRYHVKDLPALVFIKDEKVLGKIEGYYTEEENRMVFHKIEEIKKKTI